MSQPAKTADDLITVKEFYRLVPDGQKADLLDGVIYMASPDSYRSNDLTGFLAVLLRMFNEAKDIGGRMLSSRFAFRLTRYNAPEPDVAYVRPERIHLISEREMKGGPDLGVEVVSRDSRHRDYVEKLRLYQQARVLEYWIIDPLQQRAEFHRLVNKRYQLAQLEQNRIFRSEILPGFWLDVNWLFAQPLPNAYRCFRQLMK